MNERRKHVRNECSLEVRYSSTKESPQTGCTFCKDISKTGIRIVCINDIKDNDVVDLDINLKHGRPSFSTAARVVWIKKIERPAFFDHVAGLEFTQALSDDTIKSFI